MEKIENIAIDYKNHTYADGIITKITDEKGFSKEFWADDTILLEKSDKNNVSYCKPDLIVI